VKRAEKAAELAGKNKEKSVVARKNVKTGLKSAATTSSRTTSAASSKKSVKTALAPFGAPAGPPIVAKPKVSISKKKLARITAEKVAAVDRSEERTTPTKRKASGDAPAVAKRSKVDNATPTKESAPAKVLYSEKTFAECSRWMAETEIKYKVDGKRAGTKSYDRYLAYSQAKTVGEALELGCYNPDLLNDYEKGLITVVGGPVRKEPLDLSKADKSTLTRADKVVALWGKKAGSLAK